MAAASSARRVPVTILTGFLGAGKTTLLNHVLRHTPTTRIAVIENEYGLEMGMDLDSVARDRKATKDDACGTAENVVVEQVVEFRELAGGCACCSIKGDLVRALHALAGNSLNGRRVGAGAEFDHVIIETTGLADPHPIANVLLDEATGLTSLYEIRGVVTVVDALNFGAAVADVKPEGAINEAERQVVAADVIVVNKCDLVDKGAVHTLTTTLSKMNGVATIVTTSHSEVSPDVVLGMAPTADFVAKRFADITHHLHDTRISTVGVKLEDEVLDGGAIHDLLSKWLRSPPVCSDSNCTDDHSAGGDESKDAGSAAVAAAMATTSAAGGTGMGLGPGIGMGMSMGVGMGLVSVPKPTGPMQVLRAKGFLHLSASEPGGEAAWYMLQGVRDTFVLEPLLDTAVGESGASNDPRKNRLVLIGKGLDWRAVTAAVKRCRIE